MLSRKTFPDSFLLPVLAPNLPPILSLSIPSDQSFAPSPTLLPPTPLTYLSPSSTPLTVGTHAHLTSQYCSLIGLHPPTPSSTPAGTLTTLLFNAVFANTLLPQTLQNDL